jgi:Ribbon-helix-helix protein, copG family
MHYMQKTEVYSWRLSPQLKAELEEAARAERQSMAQLLERIAKEWLERSRDPGGGEEERQRRLREAASKSIGALRGGDPGRAEHARSRVRLQIARRHAR